jgi:hypothetical protein
MAILRFSTFVLTAVSAGLWLSLSAAGAPSKGGSFTRRIIAVGDLHGDAENAHKVLRMADVVNDAGKWSGKVDYFVQTGDIIDRYVAGRSAWLNSWLNIIV